VFVKRFALNSLGWQGLEGQQ